MYYYYDETLTKIVKVLAYHDLVNLCFHDERNIPQENCELINGQLYDNRELDYWKTLKEQELNDYLTKAESEPLPLSNGWFADCNQKSKTSLTDADTMYHKPLFDQSIIFVDYDNVCHIVTLEEWDSIFMQISLEFERLYNLKQVTRTAIKNATTAAQLKAIVIA